MAFHTFEPLAGDNLILSSSTRVQVEKTEKGTLQENYLSQH